MWAGQCTCVVRVSPLPCPATGGQQRYITCHCSLWTSPCWSNCIGVCVLCVVCVKRLHLVVSVLLDTYFNYWGTRDTHLQALQCHKLLSTDDRSSRTIGCCCRHPNSDWLTEHPLALDITNTHLLPEAGPRVHSTMVTVLVCYLGILGGRGSVLLAVGAGSIRKHLCARM